LEALQQLHEVGVEPVDGVDQLRTPRAVEVGDVLDHVARSGHEAEVAELALGVESRGELEPGGNDPRVSPDGHWLTIQASNGAKQVSTAFRTCERSAFPRMPNRFKVAAPGDGSR
jgi:hypothetical protein